MSRVADLQRQVDAVVAEFVDQVMDCVRRGLVESMGPGLGQPRPPSAKRTSDELDRLGQQFYEFVQAHPGLRIEQINREMGTSTRDLALPIKKMIVEGRLRTEGQRRTTTYFVA